VLWNYLGESAAGRDDNGNRIADAKVLSSAKTGFVHRDQRWRKIWGRKRDLGGIVWRRWEGGKNRGEGGNKINWLKALGQIGGYRGVVTDCPTGGGRGGQSGGMVDRLG